jgi:site-specific DNA-methyltransferase (adenine-specific)
METNKVYCGKSEEVLKDCQDDFFDTIVTDPPYGLSTEPPDVEQILYGWLRYDFYEKRGRGFAGHKWDAFVPAPTIWREIFRVLKPGGSALVFAGSRTQDLMTMSMRLAGFHIKDCMMWLYGCGMTKGSSITKMMEKKYPWRGKKLQEKWDGWGVTLKPAFEPIIFAVKPTIGSLAENAIRHGVAGICIDGARLETKAKSHALKAGRRPGRVFQWSSPEGKDGYDGSKGRYPSNVLLDEKAAEALDVQCTDASRFFYSAKAGAGDRGIDNEHPTVKPQKLMEYLCLLTKTPSGGVVLDPFAGSGTTGVACKKVGREYVLIEMNKKYCATAEKRLKETKGRKTNDQKRKTA